MKRRDVIRTVGASATIGVLGIGTASAADYDCEAECIQDDCRDCPTWCGEVCGYCLCTP